MKRIEQAVEQAVRQEFREIDQLGGVLAAIEHRYQRSQIQLAAHRYEQQINEGARPIIGLNRYHDESEAPRSVKVIRTPRKKKQFQVERLQRFKRRHRDAAERALDALSEVVEHGGDVFAELIKTVEHCSLGQITARLHELVGHYRPAI
jgi:methylmalonyl-CoA mutase